MSENPIANVNQDGLIECRERNYANNPMNPMMLRVSLDNLKWQSNLGVSVKPRTSPDTVTELETLQEATKFKLGNQIVPLRRMRKGDASTFGRSVV